MKITRRQLRRIIKEEISASLLREGLKEWTEELEDYVRGLELTQQWQDEVLARATKDCARGDSFSKWCALKHAYQVGQEMGFEKVGVPGF